MSKVIKLKRGLDINLAGKAPRLKETTAQPESFALKPTDFKEISPKILVKADDEVKAGTPLFCDKNTPEIQFVSPVSGRVLAINRGDRRRVLEVVVLPDGADSFVDFGKSRIEDMGREEVVARMLQGGVWPFITQRPYGVIAQPAASPKAIFVSGFDSAPLAPDYTFSLEEDKEFFQAGMAVLSKLAPRLFLNLHEQQRSSWMAQVRGAEVNYFSGPHPAGNVGIQIHHLLPIQKGEVVWTVRPADVPIIGKLFSLGRYLPDRWVALGGSEVRKPSYVNVRQGAQVHALLTGRTDEGELRYISGNVLTGEQVQRKGYLGFFDNQLTVIPEGRYYELFGWALPGFGKFSVSRTFFSWLKPSGEYKLDTNTHGGERAFVLTGQYDKVLPMDILPVHLVKACITDDIDKMEQLGIYEVLEEDLALCEFVCTSKIEVQSILRKGLDLVRKELS